VRVWTAYTRVRTPPVLVREGFCWSALVFGPFWLLARGAWIPAVLGLLAGVLVARIPAVLGVDFAPWLEVALAAAFGLFGRDLWRWSLERRGFVLTHVVAAGDEDEAFARLLARRPDLVDVAVS
jgi:hypothetical protein